MGWLIVAFTWGMLRLAFVLYGVEDGFGSNPGNWTFGQLVSVLLLAAPLITMVGYFDHGKLWKFHILVSPTTCV